MRRKLQAASGDSLSRLGNLGTSPCETLMCVLSISSFVCGAQDHNIRLRESPNKTAPDLLGMENCPVVTNVIFHERGNEVVTMVVSMLHAQLQRLACFLAGGFEDLRKKLFLL